MTPQEESLFFHSRILSALKEAKASGAEMLSIAFPELPEAAFANLALAPKSGLLFFFENEKKELAEAAFSGTLETVVYKNAPFETLENLFPKKRFQLSLKPTTSSVPSPKLFVVGTFENKNGALATIPAWQVSRTRTATQISAHISLNQTPEPTAEIILCDYARLLEIAETSTDIESPMPTIDTESEVGGDWYLSGGAKRCIDEIESGNYQKIVLARAKDFSFSKEKMPAQEIVLSALRKCFLKNNCTIFSARTNPALDDEKIIGATPEMLIRFKNKILETEAIAGTISNLGRDEEVQIQKLVADEKEQREHKIVVDFIAEKFHALGIIPEFEKEPKTLHLPNVFHLHTPISGTITPALSAGTLVEKLHPTPAMCGVPTEKTKAKILSEEPFPRENFSAPLGFIDADGNAFFAVAIRCAKISKTKMRLYAASGLVKGSVPEKEFAEIESKIAAFSSVLTDAHGDK